MCQKSIGNIRDAHQVIGGSVCNVEKMCIAFNCRLVTVPSNVSYAAGEHWRGKQKNK